METKSLQRQRRTLVRAFVTPDHGQELLGAATTALAAAFALFALLGATAV